MNLRQLGLAALLTTTTAAQAQQNKGDCFQQQIEKNLKVKPHVVSGHPLRFEHDILTDYERTKFKKYDIHYELDKQGNVLDMRIAEYQGPHKSAVIFIKPKDQDHPKKGSTARLLCFDAEGNNRGEHIIPEGLPCDMLEVLLPEMVSGCAEPTPR
jgi:hypothetical protein